MTKEIPIPFWQNPQCYVHVEYQRDELWVYTTCFNENKDPIIADYLGVMHFSHVRGFESHREVKPYLTNEIQYRSSILQVDDSDYLQNYQEKQTDFDNSELKHFVVDSHDHQLSILAISFEFSTLKIDKSNEELYEKLL